MFIFMFIASIYFSQSKNEVAHCKVHICTHEELQDSCDLQPKTVEVSNVTGETELVRIAKEIYYEVTKVIKSKTNLTR
jgi:hypothetical protein